MKMKYIKIAAGALVLLVIFIIAAVREKDPHQFEGKCSQCHVGLKDPSILVRKPNYLCLSCHPGADKRSHPSDIFPTRALPPQFPLFRSKMVCITCHFPHRHYGKERMEADQTTQVKEVTAAVPGKMPVPGPYLLRAEESGKMFCYTCHQGNFTNISVDSHAIAFKRAHSRLLDFDKKQEINDNSRECLSCHDGTISTEATTQFEGLSWEHGKSIGLSHPIGVDYEEVYMKKRRLYHPPGNLDPRIVLIDGKIGCETCHNHYSKNKKHLVMDNFRSRLCLSCHNL
jgi:predicted CXXCH cytochrome family protein